MVKGGENEVHTPDTPCVDRSTRERRPVDPRWVTKGTKGLGEEEGRELSDFKMEATMKRWGSLKLVKTNLYIGERGRNG